MRSALAWLLPLSLPTALVACDSDRSPWQRSETVELLRYGNCEALESDLKEQALAELDAILDGSGGCLGCEDDFGDGGDGAGPASEGGGGDREEGTDYSGTNNQEAGVDEADLVKTDGRHLYVVNGSRLHIYGVPEFGTLVPEAIAEVEGQPVELLLDADAGRAAVFSFVYVDSLPEEHPLHAQVAREEVNGQPTFRTWALSKVSIFDVSDAGAPTLERELWLEGWYQTARRNDHSLRAVVNGQIVIPGLDDWWLWNAGGPSERDLRRTLEARIAAAELDDMIPRLYERRPDGDLVTHSLAGNACGSFYHPTDSSGRGTTSIISVDLASSDLAYDAETVVSNWATVYASEDRLYLAEGAWDWWWANDQVDPGEIFVPATNLHAFDISDPGESAYLGSGRIDGNVIGQFALDEEDGRLRVAATTTPFRMWSDATASEPAPVAESHVYILEENGGALATVGHLGGIAPGESIFAARFLADQAYLVTFEQIDPLFTIDLSEPRRPRLVGELEVPGFSTYLHPIADGRLLAIGVGGDQNGANWLTQVSMFDVSNLEEPSLMDTQELITEGWGWSEAMYEHKAFQYFAPAALLAVPLSGYTESVGPEGYTYQWTSRLELLDVDPATGFGRRGTIDHTRFYDSQDWSGTPDIRRTIFMGDYLYALSARALTVHRLDDLSEVAVEDLPGPSQGDTYWWW